MNPALFLRRCIGVAAFSASAFACAADVPKVTLSIGRHVLRAEVAASFDERAVGLMNRRSMPDAEGMLFVFEGKGSHCMWMKDTLLPLAVAFIDDDGRIINVEEMAPETEDSHCASHPARYALEMNRGWFARNGIKPGQRIKGIDAAPAAH